MIRKIYKIKTNLKLQRVTFLFLYLFVLLVTTFHHHPINFADASAFFNSAPIEGNGHNFTSEECPIIIFSQNGFNSTFALNTSIVVFFRNQTPIEYVKKTTIKKREFSSFTHRGPPNFIV